MTIERRLGWCAVMSVACVAASAPLVSCGGDPPDEAMPRTARLELASFEVGPGEQGLVCQTFANPFGEDVDVVRWTAELTNAGHHALVFAVPDGVEQPLAPCAGSDFTYPIVFQGQAAGEQSMRYPQGVAAKLPASTALHVQIHYLNPSSETVRVENAVELEAAPPGDDLAHVAPLRFENIDIAVPPGGEATVSRTCEIPTAAEIVWVVSHMHAHGTHAQIAMGDVQLYASDTWVDPPTHVFDPPRAVPAGTELTFSCSYLNTSTSTVTFGPSLETDEMCVMVGAYVDRSGTGEPLDCGGLIGDGCVTCMVALVEQAPDKLCDDDGPPSSKEIYEAMQACTCGEGADACGAACADSGCAQQMPSDACLACIDEKCSTEKTACFGGAAGP